MTPEEAIYDLDISLAEDGQDVILRHFTGTQKIRFDVTCKAFVRGFTPSDLVGNITQDQAKVILSPTEINQSGWPGPAVVPTTPNQSEVDRRVPKKNFDAIVIAGKERAVEVAVGLYMQNVLVRIEARVAA